MNAKEILERADWPRVAKLSAGIAASGALVALGLRRGGATGIVMTTVGGYFLRRMVLDAIERPPISPEARANDGARGDAATSDAASGKRRSTANGGGTLGGSAR